MFWILKFWAFDFSGFFFVFVNMGPNGSQNFKTLLPQISFESFQTFSEISSQWSWQKYCFGFLKFWVFDFSEILFLFVNMGPYGRQNAKTLLLNQITFDSFHFFVKFLLSGPHKSTVLDFWNFDFFIFPEFCSFPLVCQRVLLTLKWLRSFWGHSVYFWFSKILCLKNSSF